MWLIAYPYDIIGLLVLGAVVVKYTQNRKRNPKNLPYPPGPKGLPILGAVFDMPTTKPWLVYHDWQKEYGDMIYLEAIGQPILVLNTMKRNSDLLEKRARIYSDRPRSTMLMELMGWDFNFALLPYGDWWRRHRRQFHEHFHPSSVKKYSHIQGDETKALLLRLLERPKEFPNHIRRLFAGVIMRVAYGIPVKTDDDEYISRAETALHGFAVAALPGAFLVDFIPALKYIPSWVPGAGFQRKAAHWNDINVKVRKIPFNVVRQELNAGKVNDSVAAHLIKELPKEDDPAFSEEERIAEDVTGVAFAGGADTTLSTIQAFFLAMAMYPEVLKRAQAEIDMVVGPDRLPDESDRASLHYIEALCKEMMRWHQVVPLGLAHALSQDDEYDGYFIPKGTIVMSNTWAILHDPAVFTDPFEFQPERYMRDGKFNPDVMDPATSGAFGYGRRICPGRHLSSNSLYTVVSMLLAVFDIMAPLGTDGRPRRPNYEVTSGVLSYPLPFDCDIKPRNADAERLIKSVHLDEL